jgi:hypothetical protein
LISATRSLARCTACLQHASRSSVRRSYFGDIVSQSHFMHSDFSFPSGRPISLLRNGLMQPDCVLHFSQLLAAFTIWVGTIRRAMRLRCRLLRIGGVGNRCHTAFGNERFVGCTRDRPIPGGGEMCKGLEQSTLRSSPLKRQVTPLGSVTNEAGPLSARTFATRRPSLGSRADVARFQHRQA